MAAIRPNDLDQIAARYPNARKSGSGWKIPCPVHNGEDCNCYIGVGDGGGLVARCWSHGCSWKDIAGALGLLPDRNAQHFQAAYEHSDGTNRNVYRKDNNGDKRIWGKGSAGAKLLLYKDELTNDDTIVICEGEKAAEALLEMDLPNIVPASYRGGTGSVHKADYSPVYGHPVIVWPDADEPGRKAGIIAAEKAQAASGIAIRIVDTEGLQEGVDAADVSKELAANLLKHAVPIELWPSTSLQADLEKEKGQHGGARPGAGRPPLENPSEATLVSRRYNLRVKMINWSLEAGLPLHLRFDEIVACTLARLTKYARNCFLLVDDLPYIANGSVWRRLDHRDPVACNRLWQFIESSNSTSVIELPEETPPEYEAHLRSIPNPGRLLKQVIDSVPSFSHIIFSIAGVNFNDRNAHPIIPFTDGNALCLRTGEVLSPSRALEYCIMDTGWLIPPTEIKSSILIDDDAAQIIDRQYGVRTMDRMATYLLGIDKATDVVRLPSNAGKTTLFDLLALAFPGAWAKENATQIVSEGSRFTPLAVHMTKHVGVFLDEATHESAQIPASMLNSWDAMSLEIRELFQNRKSMRRIASLCILASDEWPHIDASAQGAKSRFKWAVDRQNVGRMEPEERLLLLSQEVVLTLRRWLMWRAHTLIVEHGSVGAIREEQEGKMDIVESVAALFKERQNPIVQALAANFSHSHDYEDYVTVPEVKKVLKAEGIERVSNKLLPQQMGKALDLPGKVESDKVSVEQPDGKSKQERVFRNVVKA